MAEVTEKDKILYFTHAKFITEGFYKTTMDEIAKDLQMSKTKQFYVERILQNEGRVTPCVPSDDTGLRRSAVGYAAEEAAVVRHGIRCSFRVNPSPGSERPAGQVLLRNSYL